MRPASRPRSPARPRSRGPRSRPARQPAVLLVVLTTVAVSACGEGEPDPGPASAPAPVRIWLDGPEGPVAVDRPGAAPTLRGVLTALAAGPMDGEREAGLGSWFGPATRDVVRSATVEDGRAVVDFADSLPRLMPGAGSSAGGAALLAALDSTVFQLQAVDSVEYRLGGSCEAFWEWLQRECRVVVR